VNLHGQPSFCRVGLSRNVRLHAALMRGGSLKGLPHVFRAAGCKTSEFCARVARPE